MTHPPAIAILVSIMKNTAAEITDATGLRM